MKKKTIKKKLISLIAAAVVALGYFLYIQLKPEVPFQITFIDVGQGDAALVACEGEFMLIDAGPDTKESCEQVRRTLLEQGVKSLKYLAISHLHEDHYGGIAGGALEYVAVENVLCNETISHKKRLANALEDCPVTVPDKEDSFALGSAKIDVIDVSARENNDSLVLMVHYGNTRFLFTGDIEKEAHRTVAAELRSLEPVLKNGENLIKMPHHGAYNSDEFLPENAWDNSLGTLLSASYATYFVIPVGADNSYGHPHRETLKLIRQVLQVNELEEKTHLLRTDELGNITVLSDGKTIQIANFS